MSFMDESRDLTERSDSALAESVRQRIVVLRGHNVILDTDMAAMCGVEVRAWVQAVKRNPERFPSDVMFQLDADELAALTSQPVISKSEGRGGRRTLPYAFTEQGVAMLSSVLRSERAVVVNIAIMRASVQLRQMLASHTELARKVEELEQRISATDATRDAQIAQIVEAIRQLMQPPKPRRNPIGFRADGSSRCQITTRCPTRRH